MKPDIKWLDDPEVFRVMQLPAHSDHRIYTDKEEMRTGRSSLYQVLDGIWDFHYSRNAAERPVRFYEEGFDDSRFDRIKVPCTPGRARFTDVRRVRSGKNDAKKEASVRQPIIRWVPTGFGLT